MSHNDDAGVCQRTLNWRQRAGAGRPGFWVPLGMGGRVPLGARARAYKSVELQDAKPARAKGGARLGLGLNGRGGCRAPGERRARGSGGAWRGGPWAGRAGSEPTLDARVTDSRH